MFACIMFRTKGIYYFTCCHNAVAMEMYFEIVKKHTKKIQSKLMKIFKTQSLEK